MPQLIFYIESGYPQIYNLLARKATIGRNEDNDIHLNDPRVSVYHAELVRKGDGVYQLCDLDSDNGTAVNGKLIEETVLQDGDQIKIGSVNAAFVDQSESAEDKLLRETVEKDLESKSDKLAKIEEAIEARNRVLVAIPESKSELESLENKLMVFQKRNEVEASNLDRIRGEIESYQKKGIDLRTELETQEGQLEELGKDRAELQGQYRKVQTANENSVRLKEELNVELENLRKEIDTEKAAFKDIIQAHEEAKAVIEKARAIQARMGELETGLKHLKVSCEEFGAKTAAREAIYQKLGEDIASRNRALEELTQSLESRHRAAEKLSRVIVKNDGHIKSSSDLLEMMESTLQKEIDEVTRSQETQRSLYEESLSLSRLISGKTRVLHRLSEKFDGRNNGSEEAESCPPLRVINPSLRYLVQYFQHGAGVPNQDRVSPVGYYGLAACTKGSMHREADTIPAGDDPVLLLLHGDFDKDKALIESVSREMPGSALLVSWREGQLDALTLAQEHVLESRQITDLLAGVSGIVSVDARTAEMIDGYKVGLPHLYVPLPIPVDIPDWNIPVPASTRSRGVFVSFNRFDPSSPLHLGRLNLLNQLVAASKTTVTLYHPSIIPETIEGLMIPDDLVTVHTGILKYGDCLARMREHQFVTGFGNNPDGGEVLGDAMLSRAVFIGADFNSLMDQLLFPDFCVKGHDIGGTLKNATRLLSDRDAYDETVEQAQSLASELISFESVRDRLSKFIHEMV